MPKLIAGIAAFIALSGGILAQVDPVTTVMRAGVAFFVGYILTMIWYVFFATKVHPVTLSAARPRRVEMEAESEGVS